MKATNTSYLFTLREHTEFPGKFNGASIKVKPAALNGMPLEIAVENILKIHRVDDTHWAPPKFKYFIFELSDHVKIAGRPIEKTCSVSTSFEQQCKVEFDNMITVEKIG